MTIYTPEMPNPALRDLTGLASTYAAGTHIAPHSHPAHQIIHATRGTMRVLAGDGLWFLPPGRALWMPAGMTHAITCSGAVAMRTAYLSCACKVAFDAVRVIGVSGLMREVLIRLAEPGSDPIRGMLAEILIHEIETGVAEPFCLPLPGDARIAGIAARLQADPGDATPLTAWARELGFSERSLIRAIRRETGLTFREFRRHTRVMVAIERLSAGQPVTAVALDVGFESPSAFIHAFRLVTGQTPGKFLGV